MGMFDEIEDELFCPFCGEKDNDFQTKDLKCLMNRWSIKDIKRFVNYRDKVNIYTRCKKCNKWIELIIEGRNGKD